MAAGRFSSLVATGLAAARRHENLGRAYRLLFHPRRRERAASYFRWRRRLANERLVARELREEASVVASQPHTLYLDPTTVCNLRCPFCPTGGGYGRYAKTVLDPERFARIVGHLRVDMLLRVGLYNWGEPLLNPHVLDFVRFFGERRIETEITTNFSHRDYDDAFLAEMVAAGLTRLVVSVDGATQEAYAKYRVRGDLPRVLGNMERLAAVKARLGVDHPSVQYKMLLHRHNQHEVDAARRLAAERGAEFALNDRFWCPPEHRAEWQADAAAVGPAEHTVFSRRLDDPVSTFCRQLWDSVVVSADGDVYPCCLLHDPQHVVGNLVEQDLDEIRNGERMVKLRRWVADPDEADPTFANGCVGCTSRWCVVAGRGAAAATTSVGSPAG